MKFAKKHAYLILVHANPYVLEKLLLLLDDERNDIYIHVDKKTNNFDFSFFANLVTRSNLIFIDRISVYWGHVSMIRAELDLFRAAFEGGNYSYYHLISGSDLPIQTQDYIHHFFQKNMGEEFIGFSNDQFDRDRIDKIHLFSKYMRARDNEYTKRLLRKIRQWFILLQKKLNYNSVGKEDKEFRYGSQWVSITHDLVANLLREESNILSLYRYSNCPDEIYKQSFVANSVFKDKVFNMDDELYSCQRFMDWKRGRPYTFREDDLRLIISSGLIFARKFEDEVDKNIVDSIYKNITQRQDVHKD